MLETKVENVSMMFLVMSDNILLRGIIWGEISVTIVRGLRLSSNRWMTMFPSWRNILIVVEMEVQWQKQQVMIQDLMMKLEALEAREVDWEEWIAIQEDTIQILLVEVEELKGKMCCCQDSPCISRGSGQAESPYELEGEALGSSYVLAPVEETLILIQGGERRGAMHDLESVDPSNVVLDELVIGFRTFLDAVVVVRIRSFPPSSFQLLHVEISFPTPTHSVILLLSSFSHDHPILSRTIR